MLLVYMSHIQPGYERHMCPFNKATCSLVNYIYPASCSADFEPAYLFIGKYITNRVTMQQIYLITWVLIKLLTTAYATDSAPFSRLLMSIVSVCPDQRRFPSG
jgi:hypothetical protein